MINNSQTVEDFIIANGQSESSVVDISRIRSRGFAVAIRASAWTAANLVVKLSRDNTNWYYVRNSTGDILTISNISTSQDGVYQFDSSVWSAGVAYYMKLISVNTGDSLVAANQGAERTLQVWFEV